MRLWSNREIRQVTLLLLVLTAAGAAGCAFFSLAAAGIALGMGLLLCGVFFTFTKWRYRQIANLIDYIRRVNGGEYALDLRDNDEGELSLLKNELYKVTVTLREQNETLRQEKKQLADAIGDISHQIKTPLTSMFVLTDLLADSDLHEQKRQEFTGRIRAQLDRLHFLVSSLLKLSRLDVKAVEFKRQQVAPQELIARSAEPLMIPLDVKNIALNVTTDQVPLRCDREWTREALLNILKNCVEHTGEGGEIAVTVSTNPLFARIVIEDTGEGIDPADLPHLFERFYRGRNASPDSVGIGLAMAAAIISQQGGHIEVRNRPQGGAQFLVTLPG